MKMAVRSKNKELARALDLARKDNRELFQENLALKKERQQLMEQVASLETRLCSLLTVHSTQESITKVLQNIESNITQANSPVIPSTSSLSFSPIQQGDHYSSTVAPLHSTMIQQDDMETDQSDVIMYPLSSQCNAAVYTMSTATEKGEGQEHNDTTTSFGRPRRACTFLVQSYQEPCLHTKLRREDYQSSFQNNSSSTSRRVSKGRGGSKKKKQKNNIRKGVTQQAGLRDITNKMSL